VIFGFVVKFLQSYEFVFKITLFLPKKFQKESGVGGFGDF